MAVQAYPFLQMTDGVDTVTFMDGLGTTPNWPLADGGWAPAIAGVRASPLGGRGPYADVQEEIAHNIIGATASACYANLDTLSRLLDKAERWWLRGESINPVLLKYAPQGSTIHDHVTTPMKAIVLGRAGTSELNGVGLPEDIADAGMLFEIYGVKIACLRRGAWTGATDTTAASGTSANPTVMSRGVFPLHPINSPIDVTIGGFTVATTPTIPPGYLMVASVANDIAVYEAEAMVTGAWTSVADAANLARGGSVLRYTPAGLTTVVSGNQSLGLAQTGTLAVIAAVRNNSATTTFQLQAVLSGFGNGAATPPLLIDTSTTQPRLVLLGSVTVTQAAALQVQASASAASGTLDIDYLIVVRLRDETVAVIAHDALVASTFSAGAFSLQALFNPTADQNPSLRIVSGGAGVMYGTYRGSLPLLMTGDTLFALWTATNGQYWRYTNVSNAIVNVSLTVTRYRSYLSPQ